MALSFNSIPLDVRTPGQFVEFDSTRNQKGVAALRHKALLVGQKLAAGTATAGVPVEIRTVSQAQDLFGAGSMLARMFEAFKAEDPSTPTYAYPLIDNAAGVAATATATFTGAVTAAGTLNLYIGGQRAQVAINVGDTVSAIATNTVAAIAALPGMPVTAAAAAGVVTLTSRHKGVEFNQLDLRHSYQRDERLPKGLALALTNFTGGTASADASGVFAAIGDDPYDTFVWPYTDAANLTAMENALETRWGPMKAIDGFAYSASVAGYSGLATLGTSRNAKYSSILGITGCPTPPWEIAASYGAVVGDNGSRDPARPFQTLRLSWVQAPNIPARHTRDERDLLLHDGISTVVANRAGHVLLERPISTYQLNASGFADIAYLDVNTALTLSRLRFSLRARIAEKYPRHKLADDGAPAGRARYTVTPSVLKAEVVAWYQDCVQAGLVEGVDKFSRKLSIERDNSDPNRVNAYLPPDIINQFRVFAAQIDFAL